MYLELIISYTNEYEYMIDNKYWVDIDPVKKSYKVGLHDKYVKYLPIIRKIAREFPEIEKDSLLENIDFTGFYQHNKDRIKDKLIEKDIIEEDIDALTDLIFWESLNLSRIAPFLYDKRLDEIFINGPDYYIYVEHEKYGKLRSNITVTKTEVISFIRFLEFIRGEGILNSDGILEIDINTTKFHYRILIDSPLIAFGNYVFCIRNLRRFDYNLERLLKENSLTPEILTLLLLATYFRMNIIIAGPPSSGKTTLLNSLVTRLPDYIRRLSIEDAREIIDLRGKGYNQVFYCSSRIRGLDKRKQIVFTLRRSPDYLIIGETLTEEDVKALFYSLSLGLNIVTTIHSYSIDSLIRRWLIHEKIESFALADVDLIILMDREFNSSKRRVKNIYLIFVGEENKIRYKALYTKDRNRVDKLNEEFINDFVERISKRRGIKREKIKIIYNNFLEMLRKQKIPEYDEMLKMVNLG